MSKVGDYITLPKKTPPSLISRKRMFHTCSIRFWDLLIPSDLLKEILSRLGLKDNIIASVVCKTWLEGAASVRKLQPRPWLFYPQKGSGDGGDYILFDQSSSETHKLNFPELKKFQKFSYSRDGWLLVIKDYPSVLFLLNPFTQERIDLSERLPLSSGYCLAFSAAPTSTSCLVFSLSYTHYPPYILIETWRPGETKWTSQLFKTLLPYEIWSICVYSNGMFYCLSTRDCCIVVFNPSRGTLNDLPVKPPPAFSARPVWMTEHDGDIFVYSYLNDYTKMFKLNLKLNVWEEMRELGGLTIFGAYPVCLTRAGYSTKDKNKIICQNQIGICTWVDPPHLKV